MHDDESESDSSVEGEKLGDRLFKKKPKPDVDLDSIKLEVEQVEQAIAECEEDEYMPKPLAKLVRAKKDLLMSYRTYLSFYHYEQWHID